MNAPDSINSLGVTTWTTARSLDGVERGLSVSFRPIELATIRLASSDSLSSLRHAGPLSRLMHVLIGTRMQNELADPRLEALRRLSVVFHAKALDRECGEIDAALSAGYSISQISILAEHFDA